MKKIMFVDSRKRLGALFFISIFFIALSASSQSGDNCSEVCNWYSAPFAVCENQDSGWGWENAENCIGRDTCNDQWGDGGVEEHCDDIDDADAQLCATLDGRSYYSNILFQSFHAATGYRHREATFSGGTLTADYDDIVIAANYRCENGDVIADLPGNNSTVIDFAEDLNTMNFSAQGGSPIAYSLKSSTAADCSQVMNTRYYSDPDGSQTPGWDPNAWIHFLEQPEAKLGFPGPSVRERHYTCQSGELQLHSNMGTSYSSSSKVTIEDNGAAIVYFGGSSGWRFLRYEDTTCDKSNGPVCSIVPTNSLCDSEPCEVGYYQTFANRCESDAAGASFRTERACHVGRHKGYASVFAANIVESLSPVLEVPWVRRVHIEGDTLFVTVNWNGCSRLGQKFDLQIEQNFLESHPVQANWAFIPRIYQACQAEQELDLIYDLSPLRNWYEAHYGTEAATIVLPGLVDYKINQKDNETGATGSSCTDSLRKESVRTPIVIPTGTTFDGNCKTYTWKRDMCAPKAKIEPLFQMEPGSTLKNVVLGPYSVYGVDVSGDATIENLNWPQGACGELIVIKPGAKTVKISGITSEIKVKSVIESPNSTAIKVDANAEVTIQNALLSDIPKVVEENGGQCNPVNVRIEDAVIANASEGVFHSDCSESEFSLKNVELINTDEVCVGNYKTCSVE